MPHIGVMELGLLLLVVMFVFGVGRLPEIGGAIGKGIRDFRQAQSGLEEAAKAVESETYQRGTAG